MPGTTFRSSNPARLTAFAEPKCASSARFLAEPTPGIPESGESSILFFRLVLWLPIAKRCASSLMRWTK